MSPHPYIHLLTPKYWKTREAVGGKIISFSFEVWFFSNTNADEIYCFLCADPLQAKKVRKVPPGLPSSVSTHFFDFVVNKLISDIQYLLGIRIYSTGVIKHTSHNQFAT